MTKINGNNEDPPQDVAQALSDAQATIEQFKAAAAEKAKNSPPPVSVSQGNGVNAQGQNVTITNADGSTTNPETGITTPASTQPVNNSSSSYTGANGVNAQGQNVTITNADGSTTNPETGITTPASIIGNSPVVKASQSAAVPASMKGGYGRATAESVSYRDDQALARIVELSRR
jgi:hypothetical protein